MESRRIIDMHTHAYTPGALGFMREYLQRAGLEALSIASFGCDRDGCAPEENILPLIFKLKDDRILTYGSLLYPECPVKKLEGVWAPEIQAERLLAMGCDGIKILESKPDSRKMLGLPLDSDMLNPMFGLLERRKAFLLWHVADPPEFWDPSKAPAFAVEAGWVYDESFPSWEKTIGEALHVLERHRELRAVFAHFFFHSQDASMAESVMERFPAARFDLTPGIEMYVNFSDQREVWRDFFVRRANRILFGTDTDESCSCIMSETEKDPVLTVSHIRRFLETDEVFSFWGHQVRGLSLPDEALDRIYRLNFKELVPERNEVDRAALREYAGELIDRIPSEETRRYISEELDLEEGKRRLNG